MKRKAIVGIMLMLVFLMIPLFYTVPRVSAPSTIKIGILGPMGWTVGDGMLKGAQLAAQVINDAGGILGTTVQVLPMADTLRGEPDPTPTTGTLAMQDLVTAGADFAFGCLRTESAQGARVVAADNSLIFFICGAATDFLIDDGVGGATDTVREDYTTWKYIFRNTPMNSTILVRSLAGLWLYGIKGYIARLIENKLVRMYGTVVNNSSDPNANPILKIYGAFPGPAWTTIWSKPVLGPGWPQVKYAVISENPVWADTIHAALTAFPTYAYLLGPYARMVYQNRVSATATDISDTLDAAVNAGAELIIHIFSGPVGKTFTNQWKTEIADEDRPVVVGINVAGQDQPEHWTETAGRAEFEAFLATAGTRTPINTVPGSPANTADYWDLYLNTYGDAPVYTSYGVYDSIIALRDTINAWATGQGITSWPGRVALGAQYDLIIPYIEKSLRQGIAGWFKYTGPHLATDPAYGQYPSAFLAINPTRAGTLHDMWVSRVDLGTTSSGYVRAVVAQWQGPAKVQPEFPPGTPAAGRLEVVSPVDRLYCRRYRFARWYWYGNKTGYATNAIPLDGVDINFDGRVSSGDASAIIAAMFSTPGALNWNIESDAVVDGTINIFDALAVSATFWTVANLPYP